MRPALAALAASLAALPAQGAPPAELLGAGLPAACQVPRGGVRSLPDLDGDRRPERVVRCLTSSRGEKGELGSLLERPCEAVYLLRSARGARPELLAAHCPEPQGASTDELELDEQSLRQTRTVGSAWSWTRTCTLELSPLRVRSFGQTHESLLCASSSESRSLDVDQALERVVWSAPLCLEGGRAECRPDLFAGSFASIPLHRVRALAGAPRPAPADARCRLALRGQGYLQAAASEPDGPTDAEALAWAEDDGRRLLLGLEVRDDRFVREAARPEAADHVELWLSARRYGYRDPCVPARAPGLVRYLILPGPAGPRVLAPGQRAPLEVSAAARWTAGRLLLSLELRGGARRSALEGSVSVVYSDSDDGKRAKYRIASSRLRDGDPRSLGQLRESGCAAGPGGALVYRPPRTCAALIPPPAARAGAPH